MANHFSVRGSKINIGKWSELFVDVWLEFVKDQNALVAKFGKNHISIGWDAVGLSTGNVVESKFWANAINTLGELQRMAEAGSSDTGRTAQHGDNAPALDSTTESPPHTPTFRRGREGRALSDIRQIQASPPNTSLQLIEIGETAGAIVPQAETFPTGDENPTPTANSPYEASATPAWTATRHFGDGNCWLLSNSRTRHFENISTESLCQKVGSHFWIHNESRDKHDDEEEAKMRRKRKREVLISSILDSMHSS